MGDELHALRSIMELGGWVMYPLLALSILSLALSIERFVFWRRLASRDSRQRLDTLGARLRAGDLAGARAIASLDRTAAGLLARRLVDQVAQARGCITQDAARELLEAARTPLERFATTQSTIITAAPLLGILGTVLGIIRSFGVLSEARLVSDPGLVAGGIAEALYTTAFGLVVALITLFPYAWSRAQCDHALGRLEALVSVGTHGVSAIPVTEGRPKVEG
jgi:biopolymer transport protein ExbB